MKTYPLSIKLLAVISISAFAGMQARADGIAENAMAAEKAEKSPDVLTTPPHRVEQTGIKTGPGKLIHPVIQDSDVEIKPVPRVRPTQEDYHTLQTH